MAGVGSLDQGYAGNGSLVRWSRDRIRPSGLIQLPGVFETLQVTPLALDLLRTYTELFSHQ